MINHSSSAKADVTYEFLSDSFQVLSSEPVVAGEQLLISYGTRSNDQLLQYMGFVEPNNPHDAYVLAASLPDLIDDFSEILAPALAPNFLDTLASSPAAATDALVFATPGAPLNATAARALAGVVTGGEAKVKELARGVVREERRRFEGRGEKDRARMKKGKAMSDAVEAFRREKLRVLEAAEGE